MHSLSTTGPKCIFELFEMDPKVTLVRTEKYFGPISNGTNIHSWSNLTWNLDQKFTIQRFEGGSKEEFKGGIINFEVISNT